MGWRASIRSIGRWGTEGRVQPAEAAQRWKIVGSAPPSLPLVALVCGLPANHICLLSVSSAPHVHDAIDRRLLSGAAPPPVPLIKTKDRHKCIFHTIVVSPSTTVTFKWKRRDGRAYVRIIYKPERRVNKRSGENFSKQ